MEGKGDGRQDGRHRRTRPISPMLASRSGTSGFGSEADQDCWSAISAEAEPRSQVYLRIGVRAYDDFS